LEATVRTYSQANRELVPRLCAEVLGGIAAAHGVAVEIEHDPGYPVTVNDDTEAAFVAETVREVFGPDRYHHETTPEAPSEDFSFVLNNVPGAYLFLGACDAEDPESAPSNHSPQAVFDDSVVPDGAALLAELAVRRLAR
jgi:hippurate hydrolase